MYNKASGRISLGIFGKNLFVDIINKLSVELLNLSSIKSSNSGTGTIKLFFILLSKFQIFIEKINYCVIEFLKNL